MKEPDHDEVTAIVKDVFPPVETEMRRDLWPAMLRRMESAPVPAAAPWYDWALAGGLAGAAVLFPKLMLLIAYHL